MTKYVTHFLAPYIGASFLYKCHASRGSSPRQHGILVLFLGNRKSRLLCRSVPAILLYFHLYFVFLLAYKSFTHSLNFARRPPINGVVDDALHCRMFDQVSMRRCFNSFVSRMSSVKRTVYTTRMRVLDICRPIPALGFVRR